MANRGQKTQDRPARERFEQTLVDLREGSYRFASRARGQAGIIVEELIDPDGDCVATLAEAEGDAGALALAMPLELIRFETWLFGQIGDQEELDLDAPSHREIWFNFGAWIGETMRRRHGGHWLVAGDAPASWRLGFSKVLLEIAPHQFAHQLLQAGQGAARRLVAELERLRLVHQEQRQRDGGQELDRFTPETYIRMHTVPVGQWLAMDLGLCNRLWRQAATRDLIKELKKHGKRLHPSQAPVVAKLAEALEKADPSKPLASQTTDRVLFEGVAQVIGVRRATAPIAMDVLESMVIPAMHVGIPDQFPPLDEDDLANLRKGIELFAFFVDVVPHKHPAQEDGFLRAIAAEKLSSPYLDTADLEVGKGDWVVVEHSGLKRMLLDFDSRRLVARYDEFVAYVRSNPQAPRRRDEGRMLAETVARALADLRACVMAASPQGHALVFRMLPPPA